MMGRPLGGDLKGYAVASSSSMEDAAPSSRRARLVDRAAAWLPHVAAPAGDDARAPASCRKTAPRRRLHAGGQPSARRTAPSRRAGARRSRSRSHSSTASTTPAVAAGEPPFGRTGRHAVTVSLRAGAGSPAGRGDTGRRHWRAHESAPPRRVVGSSLRAASVKRRPPRRAGSREAPLSLGPSRSPAAARRCTQRTAHRRRGQPPPCPSPPPSPPAKKPNAAPPPVTRDQARSSS